MSVCLSLSLSVSFPGCCALRIYQIGCFYCKQKQKILTQSSLSQEDFTVSGIWQVRQGRFQVWLEQESAIRSLLSSLPRPLPCTSPSAFPCWVNAQLVLSTWGGSWPPATPSHVNGAGYGAKRSGRWGPLLPVHQPCQSLCSLLCPALTIVCRTAGPIGVPGQDHKQTET
jgi:hypothetical protein